ncbi:uncharacterized protein LOC129954103, partial [Eupeodes corollae]|uniref:uncharacterized protein LOC129954103 n=1 Tax=Eupeodes corollae TaxID=290404 RepID=UPI0024924E1C
SEINELLAQSKLYNEQSRRNAEYGTPDVRFTLSSRGNNLLTIDGMRFTLNRKMKDASYWECVKLRCKKTKCIARVISKDGQVVSMRGTHNHD